MVTFSWFSQAQKFGDTKEIQGELCNIELKAICPGFHFIINNE